MLFRNIKFTFLLAFDPELTEDLEHTLPSQISETSSAVTCDCSSFYGMKWGKSLIVSKHSSMDKP
jgi:hypothetical protein